MILPNTAGYRDDDLPSSGFKYVRRSHKGSRFTARPCINGGRQPLGTFPNARAAWQAVLAWTKAGCPTDHRWRPSGSRPQTRRVASGGAVWRRAAEALAEHPDWPDGRLAERAGVSRHTVGMVRRALIADGSLRPVAVVRSDGKPNPPRGSVAAAVRRVLAARPDRPTVEVAAEAGASVETVRKVRGPMRADHFRGATKMVRATSSPGPAG